MACSQSSLGLMMWRMECIRVVCVQRAVTHKGASDSCARLRRVVCAQGFVNLCVSKDEVDVGRITEADMHDIVQLRVCARAFACVCVLLV